MKENIDLNENADAQLRLFKPYFKRLKKECIFYGTEGSLQMYNRGIDTLMGSGRVDFGITKMSKIDEPKPQILTDQFPIQGITRIDLKEYDVLYQYICRRCREVTNERFKTVWA